MLIITNAVFRAQKKVMLPLYSMIIVTVTNTIGDLGLGMGMWVSPISDTRDWLGQPSVR